MSARRGSERGDWDREMPEKAKKTYRVSVTITYDVEVGDEHLTAEDWLWGFRQNISYYSDGRHNFSIEMGLHGVGRSILHAAGTAVDAFASRMIPAHDRWQDRNDLAASIPIRLGHETITAVVRDVTGVSDDAKTSNLPILAEDTNQ